MQHASTSVRLSYAEPTQPAAQRVLIQLIETLSNRKRLENHYEQLLRETDGGTEFWRAAVRATRLQLQLNEARLDAIPKTGPLIFIANHPYGVIDGMLMCAIAMRVRGDFRVLINNALCKEPRVMRYMLPIDFTETKEAARSNIQSKHDAQLALRKDIPIVIFPAGGISTAKGVLGEVTDLEWKLFTSKMIQTSQATVVPVYFHGQNSPLFQLVSQFSLTLRLSLIIGETNRCLGKPLQINIGEAIPFSELAHIESRQVLTEELRKRVYALAQEPHHSIPKTTYWSL